MRRSLGWILSGAALAAIGLASIAFFTDWLVVDGSASAVATYTVQRRTLEDRVIERGTVESQETVIGKLDAPIQCKITMIVPEGQVVKKGDTVVELDTRELDQEIRNKEIAVNEAQGTLDEAKQALEIQINKNETDIAAAELELELAEIDLEKYRDGTYVADKADIERAIKEAEAELERIREEKNNVEILVKKGYRSPQQLKEYQLRELTFELQVDRDKQKLRVLEQFERKRQMTELQAKAEENKRKLERAKATAEAEKLKAEAAVENARAGLEMQKGQLDEIQEMRDKCTLRAAQDGTVAYANERWFDSSERIREGTEIWPGRAIYFLPDLTRMQVKVTVHESVVERIRTGQVARIRLDAFADRQLSGTVSTVANMAASSWSNIQNYDTIVLIDQLPEGMAIKPGMTAEVEIEVGSYPDTLAVPVGAVTEHFGRHYVYVRTGGDFERRAVETGHLTHAFVEITEGLEAGETVALDAWQRGLEDFSEREKAAASEEVESGAAPAVNAGEGNATVSDPSR